MKYLILIVSFLFSQTVFCQLRSIGKPRPLTKKEQYQDSANKHCIHLTKFSISQRLGFFPFKKASKVKLCSFDLQPKSFTNEIPKIGTAVDVSKLQEVVSLNEKQTISLSDILYNTGYKGIFYSFSEGCYYPRNAILFLDDTNTVFAYIELCFQCYGFKVSSKDVRSGDFCIEKYELLRQFFKEAGVHFGTELTVTD